MVFKTKYPSLKDWWKVANPLKTVLNFVIISIAKITPSLHLKNFFYRLTGMKIGKNCCIGLSAMFDIFFPELIEIGDNTIIGYNTTILAHEFLTNEWRKGKTKIGKNCMIGANCLILAGVEIKDDITVCAFSLVNKNLTKKGMYGGVPAKLIK